MHRVPARAVICGHVVRSKSVLSLSEERPELLRDLRNKAKTTAHRSHTLSRNYRVYYALFL